MTEAGRDLVLPSRTGDVVTLTLNNPARSNALSEELLEVLQGELDKLVADRSLRCVVLAATGTVFCAGHDLRQLKGLDEAGLRALFARCSAVMLGLRALPVPVIAQVQGAAVAAGCQLVAACDLAIAASSASFAVSGINIGLFCSTPAVAVSRAMPTKPALDLLLTGRFIGAVEAQAQGLVNRVVADDLLTGVVAAYAAEICSKSAEAVRIGKALFYAQRDMPLEEAYRCAGDAMARNMMAEDAQAGVGAFLDRSAGRRGRPAAD